MGVTLGGVHGACIGEKSGILLAALWKMSWRSLSDLRRPPHRNTMIDVVVLGCGPIWTGEGAAAPFIGVHILGEIRPAGGFDTLAES